METLTYFFRLSVTGNFSHVRRFWFVDGAKNALKMGRSSCMYGISLNHKRAIPVFLLKVNIQEGLWNHDGLS